MRDSNPAFGTIEILKGNMVSRRVPFFLEIGPCGLHDGNGNWDHLNLIFRKTLGRNFSIDSISAVGEWTTLKG